MAHSRKKKSRTCRGGVTLSKLRKSAKRCGLKNYSHKRKCSLKKALSKSQCSRKKSPKKKSPKKKSLEKKSPKRFVRSFSSSIRYSFPKPRYFSPANHRKTDMPALAKMLGMEYTKKHSPASPSSIPKAPEFTAFGRYSGPRYLGKNVSSLECNKLSEKACRNRADCAYFDEDKICMPSGRALNGQVGQLGLPSSNMLALPPAPLVPSMLCSDMDESTCYGAIDNAGRKTCYFGADGKCKDFLGTEQCSMLNKDRSACMQQPKCMGVQNSSGNFCVDKKIPTLAPPPSFYYY